VSEWWNYRLVQLRNGRYQVQRSFKDIHVIKYETRYLWLAKRMLKKILNEEQNEMKKTQGKEVAKIIED